MKFGIPPGPRTLLGGRRKSDGALADAPESLLDSLDDIAMLDRRVSANRRAPQDAAGERPRGRDLDPIARAVVGRVDHVTLLPNRLQLVEDMMRVPAGELGESGKTLILLTLADARHYNDILRALGLAFGDDLVRAGAARIINRLPAGVPLYHVSVLSFAMLMDGYRKDDCPPIVKDLVSDFAAPIVCSEIPIQVRAGLGVGRYGREHASPMEALRTALIAAQDSRSTRQGWANYDRKSDEAHLRAFQLLADLSGALQSPEQMALHYQPRVNLKTGRCVGAEALLRWSHPTLGEIAPGEFVPLAETTALIRPLTDWVLNAAVRQRAQWSRRGIDPKISINVSPANLREEGFVDRFEAMLTSEGVKAGGIEFEVTEGAVAAWEGTTMDEIEKVRVLGIEISIDDFGTGYSNINYLTQLPANTLKIDRSFIMPLTASARYQVLVKSIIGMASDLNFKVVAEGIETREAMDMLIDLGCDEGQGYFFSRPMAAAAFAHWWTTQT